MDYGLLCLFFVDNSGFTHVLHLTHLGQVTHICVTKTIIIGSDNGFSPGRCQAIIWTNAGILLIGPLGTNFSEISIGIQIFSFKKVHLKLSSAKWRPFFLGLNVLIHPLWHMTHMTFHCHDFLLHLYSNLYLWPMIKLRHFGTPFANMD